MAGRWRACSRRGCAAVWRQCSVGPLLAVEKRFCDHQEEVWLGCVAVLLCVCTRGRGRAWPVCPGLVCAWLMMCVAAAQTGTRFLMPADDVGHAEPQGVSITSTACAGASPLVW
jgi:hypothetical protein